MESKYLERFKRLSGKDELFALHGGRILIEILKQPEIKSKSGLIVAAPSDFARGSTAETSRATLAMVLLVGSGYVDTDGTDIPVGASPGQVVMVNDFGLRTFSSLPGISDYTANSVALIDESLIQMSWPSVESFTEYCKLLE